jgi:hypothetical protein
MGCLPILFRLRKKNFPNLNFLLTYRLVQKEVRGILSHRLYYLSLRLLVEGLMGENCLNIRNPFSTGREESWSDGWWRVVRG